MNSIVLKCAKIKKWRPKTESVMPFQKSPSCKKYVMNETVCELLLLTITSKSCQLETKLHLRVAEFRSTLLPIVTSLLLHAPRPHQFRVALEIIEYLIKIVNCDRKQSNIVSVI